MSTPTDYLRPCHVREPDGRRRLIEEYAQRSRLVVTQTIREMREQIPGYRQIDDPAFFEDVRQHVSEHQRVFIECLRADRQIEPEDLLFVRGAAIRRAARRLPLADFLLAYRIGQRVIWETILSIAREHRLESEALDLVQPIFAHQATVSTIVTEVYVEAEQQLLVAGERVRRDLMDDLLAGRRPANGLRREAALAAGIESGAACVVLVAWPCAPLDDEHALPAAGAMLARAYGGALAPLTVVRGDEIVMVAAVGGRDPGERVAALRSARGKLAARGLVLSIGMSTVVSAPEGLPEAYREATEAVERAGEDGLVALTGLDAFEYLTLSLSDTALRLLPADVVQLAEEDLSKGGVLSDTLQEFIDADLNATLAAERLHVHVNTVHYRLRRIEERTGLDVRRVSDVNQLMIAIKGIRAPA